MSRTAITLKFKVRCFPNKRRYWAEKLQTDLILVPLMPDVDANFGFFLVLDFSTWWRHLKTIYWLPMLLLCYVCNVIFRCIILLSKILHKTINWLYSSMFYNFSCTKATFPSFGHFMWSFLLSIKVWAMRKCVWVDHYNSTKFHCWFRGSISVLWHESNDTFYVASISQVLLHHRILYFLSILFNCRS